MPLKDFWTNARVERVGPGRREVTLSSPGFNRRTTTLAADGKIVIRSGSSAERTLAAPHLARLEAEARETAASELTAAEHRAATKARAKARRRSAKRGANPWTKEDAGAASKEWWTKVGHVDAWERQLAPWRRRPEGWREAEIAAKEKEVAAMPAGTPGRGEWLAALARARAALDRPG